MKTHMRPDAAIRWLVSVLVVLVAPSLAQAHVGVGQTSGVLHGLWHPLSGPDHVAAMVAVGLWAAQRGGRAVWVVPVTFVAMMPVGGLLGAMGIIVPFVEPGIVASMIVLGVLITAAVPMPLVAMSLLVGLFAIFHGHAHGAEIPETVSGLAYAVGFVLATGLLHCCGIGFGLYARRFVDAQPIRYAGGAIAALGIALFIA